MDELRKNQIIQLEKEPDIKIEGTVLDFEKDRINVLIDDGYAMSALTISELDLLSVTVHTHLGIKKMQSHVISALDGRNCILIENNEAVLTEQRREHVRVTDDFEFNILFNGNVIKAKTINISGGGVAFNSPDYKFNISDKVELLFSSQLFLKDLKIQSEIIKAHDDFFVAKYENLNDYDESKIVRRVFKLLAQK